MYNYNPTPPVSPLRHLPSLPLISTPLDIRRSNTIIPTSRQSIEDGSDITPRPLVIKKIKKSPSMLFRKKDKGGQAGKEKDKELKRGFLGMNFPPSPRARSSSTGVLGQDKEKGKLDRDGDLNDAQNPAGGKGPASSPSAGRMSWPQRPAAGQIESAPNRDKETRSYQRENFPPMEHNHPEGCQFADNKHGKSTFLRRASSTSAKYDKIPRQRLEQRGLGAIGGVPEETFPPKSPPKGWRQMAMDLFQGNNGNSGQAAVKRANSREGKRSDSISSTKSVLTYATPPEAPPAESDATSDVEKRVGRGPPGNSGASGMRQSDSPGRSRHPSHDGRSTLPHGVFNDTSFLAALDGNIGGKNRTRPKRCGQWKPPMLIVDLVVTPEQDTLPIRSGQSGDQNSFWISVEIEGKVNSCAGYAGQQHGVGLDVGVLMDLSVYTLNASGSVARQQLLDDIMSLSLPQTSIPPSSRNVKEAVIAAIRKLKAMPSDATKYPRPGRSAHLLLLTSQLDDGAIDLLPEVFMGQVRIHILGIGPVFSPRNEMGSSGWCVPLSTFGLKSNKDGHSEKKSVPVEEIISTLRTAVDLGEMQNVVIHLRRAEGSRILEVIGDTEYPRLVPGEKRSLLIKIDPGSPINLTTTHDNSRNPIDEWSFVEQQINSIQADLGVYETPLLTVKVTYQHNNYPPSTTLSIVKTATVRRYNEHSHWHSSPAPQTQLFGSPENSPKRIVTHEEYVYRIRSQKAASMYSNPDRALSEIQAICSSMRKAGARVDIHDISKELAYRARMEKRFSHSSSAATSGGCGEHVQTGRSGRRNLSFASDATDEVLTYWREGELLSSPLVRPPGEVSLIRLGLEEWDAEGEGGAEEDMDEAQKIWRDMKLRKYGSGGVGGIGRVRFSADANGNGNGGSAGGKSLVTLRDVRETDFGPWKV
ncbi:hypothetical protein C7212DRAFT_362443 [Tuber magnatum]|uniref:VWFA domain-containing protein n=1 Tax=Tuber magnatum TaxID=42249 RepID=A0A317STX1_9PEZI|nr:hypothetical protein C7212DRAFT_362443 [Tuber magnatum]